SFKEAMGSAGFDIGHSETPITPVMLGDEKVAREFSRRLFDEQAVFAQAIAYPTVQLGTARIRVMISAAHSEEDLSYGAAAFARVGRDLGVI
ncbi:MAG: aminotransferase class I/II-fold pyridoxal phosphate-dependent enzyme, partial [Acidimicrobiia bacterium]|nr:aminotransferase class I/II-fold pyridoxal phosphate-dependent enzyme [Acidimicrobiia bacterium]